MTSAITNRCSRSEHDWSCRRLSELIDHIVGQRYPQMKESLSTLNQLAAQFAANRGSHRIGVAADLRRILSVLTQELTLHMHKEELVVFPWIEQIESGAREYAALSRSLAAAVEMMRQEHRYIREGVARLRWLTQDAALLKPLRPEYQSLAAGLRELEADLHAHFHDEENLLFPRAIELESALLLDG